MPILSWIMREKRVIIHHFKRTFRLRQESQLALQKHYQQLVDKTPDATSEETSTTTNNLFDALPIPAVEDFDLFNWTDIPMSFDFSEPLLGFAEPSHDKSPPPALSDGELSPKPPASTFCADDCNCPTSGNSNGGTTSCAEAY